MLRLSLAVITIFLLLSYSFSQSIHGDELSIDCLECHTTDSWKINIGKIKFDHNITKFELNGQHNAVDCRSCHISLKFERQDQECISCHTDHHLGNTSQDCQLCHNTNSWTNTDNIAIHQFTRFPLVGPHINAECEDCHTSASFIDFPPLDVDCYSCHFQNYINSQAPNHVNYGLSQDCEECHTVSADWFTVIIDHDIIYPLLGGHSLVKNDCSTCHNSKYNHTSSDCVSCHLTDFNASSNPNHVIGQFAQDCQECHTTNPDWSPTTFDHNTVYPLLGGHDLVKDDCLKCHSGGYLNTPIACVTCHLIDYNTSNDPNHLANQFQQDCEECHTTNPDWTPSTFDHNTVYPLLGGHDLVKDDCIDCHTSGYIDTNPECVSCHLADFNATTDPNHITNQFSQDCEECHTTNPGWAPAIFDHNTVYPLLGGHDLVKDDCSKCHSEGYSNTSADCVSCHRLDFNAATNPNHITNQFSQDCEECHTTNPGWAPAIFDHNTVYPLLGGHDLVKDDCSKCHSEGYSNTSADCVSCHRLDFNAATDPNHITNQFSQDCEECHTTDPGWSPTTFDHNTVYPLLGGHDLVKDDCSKCHSSGYTNTSINCVSCHLADYNGAMDPNHVTDQFPQDCEQCHTTDPGWTPTIFDHNTVYPLSGGHNLVENNCLLCHGSGYSNTSTTCSVCHLNDYNTSTDPNHVTNQFPKDCEECHTTDPGWSPTTFDHNSIYPLLGGHNLVKNNCLLCHSSGYSNTSTTCSACHLNDYNTSTDPNHVINQFPKDCEECHTTNPDWKPSTFDHDGLYFPIYSGKHQGKWDNCSDCHFNSSNYTEFDCLSCHEHNNKNDVDDDHKEDGVFIDGYNYNSYSCYDCHPKGREE